MSMPRISPPSSRHLVTWLSPLVNLREPLGLRPPRWMVVGDDDAFAALLHGLAVGFAGQHRDGVEFAEGD